MENTNIVVSYSSGSIAFIIACDDRKKATNRNILLAVNTFYLKLYNEVDSRMVKSLGEYTKILVTAPDNTLIALNWTFSDMVSI